MKCNTLQHTATPCKTHTATHCNILQHAATNCNILQHTTRHTLQHTATYCNTLQHTATYCNMPQDIHCNTTQQNTCQIEKEPCTIYTIYTTKQHNRVHVRWEKNHVSSIRYTLQHKTTQHTTCKIEKESCHTYRSDSILIRTVFSLTYKSILHCYICVLQHVAECFQCPIYRSNSSIT